MTPPRLCLPVKQWPEMDQAQWLAEAATKMPAGGGTPKESTPAGV